MTTFLRRFKHRMLLPIIFSLLLILALTLEPIPVMLSGYERILTSPSVLLTDYLYIGGISATLLNVLFTTGLNLLILKWMKVEMTGSVFACVLTIAGFAFFGKNVYNALPMYFGIFLFTKATHTRCKDHVLVFLLSSGISPVVSFLIFGLGLSLWQGIILGAFTGTAIGFILPAFNVFSMKFHQGYNLYNTGFSMGVISMILTGILSSFEIEIISGQGLNNQYHLELLISILVISLICIATAFIQDPKVMQKYPIILARSGRLLTDFVKEAGKEATILNIGLMGLMCTILVQFTHIQINGPVLGAILTVLGFAAFGKHPINALPVVIGAILAVELTPIEWTIGPTLSVIFVMGLAPIAGQFGIFPGIIAGFLHLLITPLALEFQGGFDLYNNGFAAGFVCAVLAPFFHSFLKARDEENGKMHLIQIFELKHVFDIHRG